MNPSGLKSASESQSNRACDSCRAHKVRCLPDSAGGASKTCQRCARTDRQCFFTAPQKRKQRKRTDTRVAELEKEVQAMRTLFESTVPLIPEEDTLAKRSDLRAGPWMGSGSEQVNKSPEVQEQSNPLHSTQTLANDNASVERSLLTSYPSADVIDKGILSKEEAYRLFHAFYSNFVQHYPCIIFSADFTAEECRRTKPTLFLAILAAAAAEADPHLYSTLNTEVLSEYAQRTIMQHEKSLELIQAMLICTVWYYPPGRYAQLKFYEFTHMAAMMAIDIGLGKNPKNSRALRENGVKAEQETMDNQELERRRTFLVCYVLTTGVSMSMRRPGMLRWNKWTKECLESISHNSEIAKLDRNLVCWVKLLKITEDISTTFGFDDPGGSPDLSETRVRIMMTGFEKELEEWKNEADRDGMNDALLLQYYSTQLYLHEIGLHDDHPPEDFIPPMRLSKVIAIHTLPEASSSFLEASAVSISSAHKALDVIIGMDLRTLRVLPIVNYVRTCYTLIILIKLYISSKSPTSKIGSVLDSTSMRLEYYLQAITDKFIEAVGPEQYRSPFIFLGITMQFRLWYDSQKHEKIFNIPSDIGEYKDVCWLPPVSRMRWTAQFGSSAASSSPEPDWMWDLEPGPVKPAREPSGWDGSVDYGQMQSTELVPAATDDKVPYEDMSVVYGFDETMMIGGEQYDGMLNDWASSMDLPMLSDPSYPPEAFQWRP